MTEIEVPIPAKYRDIVRRWEWRQSPDNKTGCYQVYAEMAKAPPAGGAPYYMARGKTLPAAMEDLIQFYREIQAGYF